MKSNEYYISTPDAILKLFKINLSENKAFKDLVYPLVRSKNFLKIKREQMAINSNKSHILISNESLIKIYNAVLLQGFFADTKRIKDIFMSQAKRKESAEFLDLVVSGRQSILAIEIQSKELTSLIAKLRSKEFDLCNEKLPNPFKELPQLSLNGITSVMQTLLAQSALLTQDESMMIHFFNNDLEKAYASSSLLTSNHPTLFAYQTHIKQKYNEAIEFDNLLDNLLK
ncbi:hypothetical protein [Aliivibrio fischeri]|nr:hypothetical protein [Aliivibrio fischeri]